jgi:sugar lactone lactonase YvrE
MNKILMLSPIALVALSLPLQSIIASDTPRPDIVYTLDGSQSEGFAIGNGSTAYNSSPDGSIYKMDLQTGRGEVLVPVVDPMNCTKLGMRVDLRTNNLFVAGCTNSNAQVFNADDGTLLMEYQLGPAGASIVNDLAITEDAVYFTDAKLPVIYRLPLDSDGGLPPNADGVVEIALPEEFAIDDEAFCCGANGIVATDDGQTLIVGHSNLAMIYRVDLSDASVVPISVDPPLSGFIDGIARMGQNLFILTPNETGGPVSTDSVQVVKLDESLLNGELERLVTDFDLQGIASGAILGTSLYVNNARYEIFPPEADTRYWVTELKGAVDGANLISAGLSGSWFNPDTTGQGFFFDISPELNLFFGGWYVWTETAGVYDWLTVQGDYSGNVATVPIYRTTGGVFNDPQAVETTAVGVAEFVFSSRTEGQVTIEFIGTGSTTVIPLTRITPPTPDR